MILRVLQIKTTELALQQAHALAPAAILALTPAPPAPTKRLMKSSVNRISKISKGNAMSGERRK